MKPLKVFLVLFIVALAAGCAHRAPRVAWQPRTVLPTRPPYCPANWRGTDSNLEHPGYHLSIEQQVSCTAWVWDRQIAQGERDHEITMHRINGMHPGSGGASGGSTTFFFGPSGGYRGSAVSY